MTPHKVSRAQLRARLTRSIAAGAIFAAFVIGTVCAINYGPRRDDLPVTLRQVQRLNERVGQKIVHSTGALRAPQKAYPAKGTEPRVNGYVGLEDDVDLETYLVKVDSGARHLEVKIDDLEKLPRTQAATDFKCVEGWTEVFSYAGVKFSDFMKAYGVGFHEDGTPFPYVGMETPDGQYYVSLDAASMMAPDVVLAYEMNGGELTVENGFPLRLVIPSKYGVKNLKRIGRIFFSDIRPPDYWQKRGYDWYLGL